MHRFLPALCCLLVFSLGSPGARAQPDRPPPNVVLIITDDQGYGDLGITGNPHVQTPAIDAFARQSSWFDRFYVSPVCAPTRASLLTGRYALRTGVRDTYNGGAIMATEEVTIAEVLRAAGYRTGAFGKWHLGDNYPSRPNDQGFDESVVHLAGGMGQVGDYTTWFRGDSSYFDPVLWHNGQPESYPGYCTDIFAAEALRFIEQNRDAPFFCYLSFNAPHTPLQVPAAYYERYRNVDPASGFTADGRSLPAMSERDKEDARRVYAMVSCIDDNLARLFRRLDELRLTENTLVIFLTDNGPQQPRYVAGMRGRKGSVYRGGVRVPCFVRYPAAFPTPRVLDATAAHIDILPTLAELCGADLPTDRVVDGRSLVPLLVDSSAAEPDRSLFFYWTRRAPERYRNMAIQRGDYKLVGQTDYPASAAELELYDVRRDPYEQHNLATEQPERVAELKKELDGLYAELIASAHLTDPPYIRVGHPAENPIVLNRNDAGGARGIWAQPEIYGQWRVDIAPGRYRVRCRFHEPVPAGGRLYLETGPVLNQVTNDRADAEYITLDEVTFPAFRGDLIPYYLVENRSILPFWVELERLD